MGLSDEFAAWANNYAEQIGNNPDHPHTKTAALKAAFTEAVDTIVSTDETTNEIGNL